MSKPKMERRRGYLSFPRDEAGPRLWTSNPKVSTSVTLLLYLLMPMYNILLASWDFIIQFKYPFLIPCSIVTVVIWMCVQIILSPDTRKTLALGAVGGEQNLLANVVSILDQVATLNTARCYCWPLVLFKAYLKHCEDCRIEWIFLLVLLQLI